MMAGPTPATVTAYLIASEEWSVAVESDRRSIWQHSTGARVFVPGNADAPDTASLIERAVEEVAAAEERDRGDVAIDFTWDRYDRLHVRRDSEGSALPFDVAIDLHSSLRDLITASARSVVGPRRSYTGRRPGSVDEYMDGVRIIPSLPGSFVVRALLPLSPAEEPGVDPLPLLLPPSEPLRRVSVQILRASQVALGVAAEVAATGDLTLWDAVVPRGVSSNLCDALARLPGSDPANVEVRAVWSWAAPVENVPPVVVGAGHVAPLEAAADYLRDVNETHTIRITGIVTNLHRETQVGDGDATITGHVDGQDAGSRSLRLNLDADTYNEAIDAHGLGKSVTALVVVTRTPTRMVVDRVIDLTVL